MQKNQGLIRPFLLIVSFLLWACHKPYLEKGYSEIAKDQPVAIQDYSNAHYSDSDITLPLAIQNKRNLNGTVSAGFLSVGEKLIFSTQNGFLYTMDKGTFNHSGNTRPARGVSAKPALYKNRLFIAAEWLKSGLSVYDFDAHQIIWQEAKGYSVTSPIIRDERLFIAQKDGRVRSLNPKTFQEIWHFDTNESILNNLALDQTLLYVLNANGQLSALQPESGRRIWQFEIGEAVKTSPVLSNQYLMIASLSGKLYLIDTKLQSMELVFDIRSPIFRSPSAGTDLFFIGASNGQIIAFDPLNKQVKWQRTLEGPFSDSPLILKSKIVVGTDQKKLYILDKTDGAILQELDLDGRLSCMPLVFDEGLILGMDFRKIVYLKRK